jgi:hypothetical protein
MDTSQYTTNTIPVEAFLRGCVGYSVTDEALISIFVKRGVEVGTPAMSLPLRTLELCKADLYIYCATLPSTTSTVEDADAGWRHKEGGTQKGASDNVRLIQMANEIYSKYGEVTYKSTIKMKPFGMKFHV